MTFRKKILPVLVIIAIIISSVPTAFAQEDQIAEQYFEHIHSYSSETIKDVTHTENGIVQYTCSCGDWYEEIIYSPGHAYSEYTVKATHDNDGLIRYECACGDWYEEVLPAKGHKYTAKVIADADHGKDGTVRYSCACGDYYDVIIPGEKHSYQTLTIKPTCVTNGKEVKRCKICDYEIILRSPDIDPSAKDLLATDHNYVVVGTKKPTQDVDGYTQYKCKKCNDTYTAVLEHDNKYVAEMYICAKRQNSPMGHMWIYIQNKCSRDLTVGAYTVPAGQGVSLGVFGLTRADGIGIYYNVEAYTANKYGLPSMICMQEKLTADELEDVSEKILYSNRWDFFFYNCMGAAFSIWNSGATPKLIPLILPVFGRLQIMMYPHETDIDMYYPTENQVYKQKGMGPNATLEKVSAGTLENGI